MNFCWQYYFVIFLFLLLIIDLNFLIPAVITQLFIVAAELAMHARISNKKPKSETETHPVILDAKISKCSV